jgi:hypothetical protein
MDIKEKTELGQQYVGYIDFLVVVVLIVVTYLLVRRKNLNAQIVNPTNEQEQETSIK